jgi:hypothetical protein
VFQGDITVAEANALVPGNLETGWAWLMLDAGTVTTGTVSVDVVADDFILWAEGGFFSNAGQLKGPQGEQGEDGPQGDEGPEGPTAVSSDATNMVKLGGDSLLSLERGTGTDGDVYGWGPTLPDPASFPEGFVFFQTS